MSGRRICLVTTSQPSANPRLLKEADALAEAGYDVRVVGAHWARWADAFDAELLPSRAWRCEIFDWKRETHPWRFWKTRARHYVARQLARSPLLEPLASNAALSRIGPDLAAAALRERADLFIAHNIGALPTALRAGRRFGVPVAFDAEDFHSGQLTRPADRVTHDLTRRAERRLLPQCTYVTAAAPTIAEAYADLCGIPTPVGILNVFPLRERPPSLRADNGEPVSLYWYSQTIGPDRGLETAVRALGQLRPHRPTLHLRGRWQEGFERDLRAVAAGEGVEADQIVSHQPAPPEELVRLSAAYDVGLAIDPPVFVNNDLLIPNKIFTYLLAGNAVLSTRTRGQEWLARQLGSAVSLCQADSPEQMADALRPWIDQRSRLMDARRTAWTLGGERFNWDVEKRAFLDVVTQALNRSGRSTGMAA